MRSITHHITAVREDGAVYEVEYSYGTGQWRLLTCRHCPWQEDVGSGGAEDRRLGHLAHGRGDPRYSRWR